MTSFPLKIVTPDGLVYDGDAEYLIVRTTNGDVGLLANHINSVFSLGMGKATIVTAEGRKTAACIGGMLTVLNGSVSLVPTTFEWADEIDVDRADKAMEKANKVLDNSSSSEADLRLAEAKLKRALIRKNVANR